MNYHSYNPKIESQTEADRSQSLFGFIKLAKTIADNNFSMRNFWLRKNNNFNTYSTTVSLKPIIESQTDADRSLLPPPDEPL